MTPILPKSSKLKFIQCIKSFLQMKGEIVGYDEVLEAISGNVKDKIESLAKDAELNQSTNFTKGMLSSIGPHVHWTLGQKLYSTIFPEYNPSKAGDVYPCMRAIFTLPPLMNELLPYFPPDLPFVCVFEADGLEDIHFFVFENDSSEVCMEIIILDKSTTKETLLTMAVDLGLPSKPLL